ncbi:centromere protein H, isoform CRA_c, partial [Mus musculus]
VGTSGNQFRGGKNCWVIFCGVQTCGPLQWRSSRGRGLRPGLRPAKRSGVCRRPRRSVSRTVSACCSGKIEELENEIEDVKSNIEMKSLALSRMKLSVALRDNMENMGPENCVLTDDMKHILKLQKLIMKSQEESSELEKKLLDVRKKRLQLKQASRSKLLEIQIEKNKQKEDVDKMENSEMIKTMKKKLQTEIKITTVVQHTFQGLILASKTNWAEDPALRETVLQLEKDLNTL